MYFFNGAANTKAFLHLQFKKLIIFLFFLPRLVFRSKSSNHSIKKLLLWYKNKKLNMLKAA